MSCSFVLSFRHQAPIGKYSLARSLACQLSPSDTADKCAPVRFASFEFLGRAGLEMWRRAIKKNDSSYLIWRHEALVLSLKTRASQAPRPTRRRLARGDDGGGHETLPFNRTNEVPFADSFASPPWPSSRAPQRPRDGEGASDGYVATITAEAAAAARRRGRLDERADLRLLNDSLLVSAAQARREHAPRRRLPFDIYHSACGNEFALSA